MQHLLLLSLFTATTTVASVVVTLGKEASRSISLHALRHPWALLALAFGVTTSLIFAGIFYVAWFSEAIAVSMLSSVLFFVLLAFLFITAWIPDKEGYRRKIHRMTAYGAVFSMPLFLLSLLPLIVDGWLVALTLSVVSAHFIMTYMLFFVKAAYSYFLPLQAIYLAGFYTALLAITYFGVH